MKRFSLYATMMATMFSASLIAGCAETNENDDTTLATCSVQLFDGEDFHDDSILIDKAGDYATLDNLPGANGKDWTDEADSLKVGKGTTVTAWHDTDFEGDQRIYQQGDYPKIDEPSSLKITCD